MGLGNRQIDRQTSLLSLMPECPGCSSDEETEEQNLNPPGEAELDPVKDEKKEVSSC